MTNQPDNAGLDPVAIAEIIRLNEFRTPGQWHALSYSVSVNISNWIAPIACDSMPNAEFSAACSWAVPALLEEVQRLRKALALSTEARDGAQRYIKGLREQMDHHVSSEDHRGLVESLSKALDLALELKRENLELRQQLKGNNNG